MQNYGVKTRENLLGWEILPSTLIRIFHKKILQDAVCLQAKRTSTWEFSAGKTFTCKSSKDIYYLQIA
jgi:hypothetical protein